MRIDEEFLREVGLADMSAEEKEAFKQQAEEELEVRVGRDIGADLSDQQLAEFDSINDSDEAASWLEQNVPSFRKIVRNAYDSFKQELIDERMNILGA